MVNGAWAMILPGIQVQIITSWGLKISMSVIIKSLRMMLLDTKGISESSARDSEWVLKETGWNHFELRMYDAVIGRWLVPDPFRQYWSPYVAFGNNPVSRVDPDGGMDRIQSLTSFNRKSADLINDLVSLTDGTLALSNITISANRLPFSFAGSSYDDIVGFFLDLFTGGVRFTLFGRGDLDFGSNVPDNVRVVAVEMSFILDIFNALGQKFPKDQKPIVKNDTRTVENKSDRERVLDIKNGVEKAHELYHQNKLMKSTTPERDTIRGSINDKSIYNYRIILQGTDTIDERYYVPDDF